MRLMLVATLLTLPLSPALADGSFTFSNSRGGTGEASWTCDRAEGLTTCTINGTFTGAQGNTASKTRVRNTTPGHSVIDTTVTGPEGNTRTRTREFSWGN